LENIEKSTIETSKAKSANLWKYTTRKVFVYFVCDIEW